jgi:hypothetical protein
MSIVARNISNLIFSINADLATSVAIGFEIILEAQGASGLGLPARRGLKDGKFRAASGAR